MRKPRIEIEGGLYHSLTRGNYRQQIFRSDEDRDKFLLQLAKQKAKLPFLLYAYCLMPNHVHLLMERKQDDIGRIMQGLLTAYSQYHNRKYGKTGHLLQGRYKAILCQSDQYLGELVRYMHLNPVRARIVKRPEDFHYSSHRAYVGLSEPWLVDVEPVLRHFGATRKLARERFRLFVWAGIKEGHREEYYQGEEGRMLGSEEFVEQIKHRIGEVPRCTPKRAARVSFEPEDLLAAVEEVTGLDRSEFIGPKKARNIVRVKELTILLGRELGCTNAALANLLGLDSSVVSRRYESAKEKLANFPTVEASKLLQRVRERLAGKK